MGLQHGTKKALVILFPLGGVLLIFLLWRFVDFSRFSLRSADTVAIVSETSVVAEISHEVKFIENAEALLIPEISLAVVVRGPYKDTLRILVPLEAAVLSRGIRKEETFQNLHAFTVPLSLNPKEAVAFRFRYRLPALHSPYTLRLSPGRSKIAYRIKMIFPDNLEAEKTEFSGRAGLSGAVLNMPGRDKFFIVPFYTAKSPLALLKAEIVDLRTIRLRFNRSLSGVSGRDVLNFSLKDLNEKNTEISDRLFVTKSSVSGREATLKIHGQTSQPGEMYELAIMGLSDRAGNFLEPLPYMVRLVQGAQN